MGSECPITPPTTSRRSADGDGAGAGLYRFMKSQQCESCGYDVRGLLSDARCPECGGLLADLTLGHRAVQGPGGQRAIDRLRLVCGGLTLSAIAWFAVGATVLVNVMLGPWHAALVVTLLLGAAIEIGVGVCWVMAWLGLPRMAWWRRSAAGAAAACGAPVAVAGLGAMAALVAREHGSVAGVWVVLLVGATMARVLTTVATAHFVHHLSFALGEGRAARDAVRLGWIAPTGAIVTVPLGLSMGALAILECWLVGRAVRSLASARGGEGLELIARAGP